MFAPQPATCTTGRSAFVKSNLVIPCAMQAAIKTEHPGKDPSSDQLRIFIKETTYTATPLRFNPSMHFDSVVFGATEERAAARIHVLLAVGVLSLLAKG